MIKKKSQAKNLLPADQSVHSPMESDRRLMQRPNINMLAQTTKNVTISQKQIAKNGSFLDVRAKQ